MIPQKQNVRLSGLDDKLDHTENNLYMIDTIELLKQYVKEGPGLLQVETNHLLETIS